MVNLGKFLGKIRGLRVYKSVIQRNHLGVKDSGFRSLFNYTDDSGKIIKTCERFTTDYSVVSSRARISEIRNYWASDRRFALNQVRNHTSGSTTKINDLRTGQQTEYVISDNYFLRTQCKPNYAEYVSIKPNRNNNTINIGFENFNYNPGYCKLNTNDVNKPFISIPDTLKDIGLA